MSAKCASLPHSNAVECESSDKTFVDEKILEWLNYQTFNINNAQDEDVQFIESRCFGA